ncbi:MAG: helix-turn-helix transcriptional regulator [Candidatus Eisenbacteria bacterium]|uniref:Helix-turn-helix transcriptional regulator n=1 Tax=Eiseniibacteriota bacterium TaxID=2212470 RepID=A0A933SCT4_UNCEI|nr:helix-turn-helix transcriptional regulator [Candidatus Eisenbacteria bacterium]
MQIVDVTELGRRVRALRLQRGMTLKQVESLCGLSATHLSEVERGRTSPTLGALTRLAVALGRETAYFLEPEELPEVAVHRGGEAKPETLGPSLTSATLTGGIPGSQLTARELRFERGASAAHREDAGDAEQEALYFVLEGEVELRVGDETTRLSHGDALQATHALPHVLSRVGHEPARVLVTSTRTSKEPA